VSSRVNVRYEDQGTINARPIITPKRPLLEAEQSRQALKALRTKLKKTKKAKEAI